MSGSSRAGTEISRCIVILDSGISISWEFDPDGTYPGTEYHANEEVSFEQRIAQHAQEIETLFNEMEQAGRRFTSPSEPSFHDAAQRAIFNGLPRVEVLLSSKPALTEDELNQLAQNIAGILGVSESDLGLDEI